MDITSSKQQEKTPRLQAYSGILLTIGMIVRDEETELRDCLVSLQPLREAFPCELIITDTGSSDRTAAVAAEYADEVRHMRWCNDFSAARNTTLAAASGEWFFYLDADERLDGNIDTLTAFFREGIYRQYAAADCTLREYTDETHTHYEDRTARRLFRMTPGAQFHRRIMEELLTEGPVYRLETVLHHFGRDRSDKRRQKDARDLSLVEAEVKRHPEDTALQDRLEALKNPKRTPMERAFDLLRTQQIAEAERALMQTAFSEMPDDTERRRYLALVLHLAEKGRYEKLTACYHELAETPDWLMRLQRSLPGNDDACAALAQTELEDPFLTLYRMRGAAEAARSEMLDRLLEQAQLAATPPYEDILYWALRMRRGMPQMMQQLTPEAVAGVTGRLYSTHPDFIQVVLDWVRSLPSDQQSPHALHWITVLSTRALVCLYASPDGAKAPQAGLHLFFQTAAALTLLCRKLYYADVLQEENQDLLPGLHRMALCIESAIRSRKSGEDAACERYLQRAEQAFPPLRAPIALLRGRQ